MDESCMSFLRSHFVEVSELGGSQSWCCRRICGALVWKRSPVGSQKNPIHPWCTVEAKARTSGDSSPGRCMVQIPQVGDLEICIMKNMEWKMRRLMGYIRWWNGMKNGWNLNISVIFHWVSVGIFGLSISWMQRLQLQAMQATHLPRSGIMMWWNDMSWMKSQRLCHFSLSVCWNFWFVNIMDAKATAPSYASYTPAQERNYDVVKWYVMDEISMFVSFFTECLLEFLVCQYHGCKGYSSKLCKPHTCSGAV